jgi:hypothetical protein
VLVYNYRRGSSNVPKTGGDLGSRGRGRAGSAGGGGDGGDGNENVWVGDGGWGLCLGFWGAWLGRGRKRFGMVVDLIGEVRMGMGREKWMEFRLEFGIDVIEVRRAWRVGSQK